MSDVSEGGAPCDYTVAVDAFDNSAGVTSFTAPQFARIQALINQKAGGPQGNAAPIYYLLGSLAVWFSHQPKHLRFGALQFQQRQQGGEFVHLPRCNAWE
jgi:hypothetical protein